MIFLTLLCSTVSKWDTIFFFFFSFFFFPSLPWGCLSRYIEEDFLVLFFFPLLLSCTEFGSQFQFNSHSWNTPCTDSDGAGCWDEQDKDHAHRKPTELYYISFWTILGFPVFFHTWNAMIKWTADDIINIYKLEKMNVVNVRFV